MEYAQVVDEGNGGVYNRTIIDYNGERRDRMPGEILVRKQNKRTSTPSELYVVPIFDFITRVPLNGELVIIFQLPNGNATTKYGDLRWFYLTTPSLHGSRNLNMLPWIMNTVVPGSILGSVSGIANAQEPKQNTFKEKTVPDLQPYEGDLIINDRFGSSIRFTAGVDKSARAGDGSALYSVLPPWDGPAGDPLLVITTGNSTNTSKYAIEDFNNDAGSIILSTSQKIDISLAHDNLGKGVTPIRNYNKPQLLLNSDRVVINSKTDEVVLSGKRTVSVVTPNWASDMDRFFTMVSDMHDELKGLQTEVSSLSAQVNALASTAVTYGTTQSTIIAAAPIFAPLAPPNATLITSATSVVTQTSLITGKLLQIKTNLGKIDTILSTLKQ